jgi:ABC-type glycerol-3-phosphate transport system permease component
MLGRLAVGLALLGALVWTLFPIWWSLSYSLKREVSEFNATLIPFVQFRPTFEHWRWEWNAALARDGMGWALVNGTVVGILVALVATSLGLAAAISLTMQQRRAATPLLALLLVPRLLPPVIIALPAALFLRRVHLEDTLISLVAVDTAFALPLAALVLHAAVRELPRDLIEAARLDGANWWRVMWQIVAPLTRSAQVAVAALAFAMSWNEFIFAVTNHAVRAVTPTIAVGMLETRDGIPFQHAGSHLVLILLPPCALAVLTRRWLVGGMSLGAVRTDGAAGRL